METSNSVLNDKFSRFASGSTMSSVIYGENMDFSKTFAFSCYKKGSDWENNNNNRKSIAHCLNVSDRHSFYLLLAVVQSEATQESAVHNPFMIWAFLPVNVNTLCHATWRMLRGNYIHSNETHPQNPLPAFSHPSSNTYICSTVWDHQLLWTAHKRLDESKKHSPISCQ